MKKNNKNTFNAGDLLSIDIATMVKRHADKGHSVEMTRAYAKLLADRKGVK